MVCPPATSEAGARRLRVGLVVVETTSRRDNKVQMIRPYVLYVPPIPQQIQISVDQPYAGPAASCCGIIGTTV
jgi:hypothetical protein